MWMPVEVRLGSVGLGWWGKELARAATASGEATVVSAYARSPKAREAFAAELGCRTAGTLEELLADPEIDGLLVATPHTTHTSIVLAACAAGKHVLVEKPLALTVEDSRRCIEAARAAGVVLQVGHHRRKQAAVRALKEVLRSGRLGAVCLVEAAYSAPALRNWPPGNWRRDPRETPAGSMTLMGVHMVDAIACLLPAPRRVFAFSGRPVGENVIDEVTAVLLELEGGALAYVGTSAVLTDRTTLAIHGTEGSAFAEDDGSRLFLTERGASERTELVLPETDPMGEELREFARCVRTGERPEVDGEAALQTVRVLAAVVESIERGITVDISGEGLTAP
jgi:predicted dehydrogenase